METPEAIVRGIISGILALSGTSPDEIVRGDRFPLPRLIPIGKQGGTIQISKDIDDKISDLARILKTQRQSLARSVKSDEWRSWVRSEIGLLIASLEHGTDLDEASRDVLARLNDKLSEILSNQLKREYAFGTTLFSNHDVISFAMGPVLFEQRDAWLDRKFAEGDYDHIIQRRIRRQWLGKKIPRRKNNRDQIREEDILAAVGNCPYICSIKLLSSYAANASFETAITAVRLALACISLFFENSSKALSGFNLRYDGPLHRQVALQFIPNLVVLSGSKLSRPPHGPHIEPAEWQEELQEFSDLRSGIELGPVSA